MKTDTLSAKFLNCFFAFTLVFGLCIPTIGSTKQEAYADTSSDTMTVYYDFKEIKPTTDTNKRPADGTNLLFAPTSVSTVSPTEAFIGLPKGCGMMKVNGTSSNSHIQCTPFVHVKHPSTAQQSINTSVGFDGCDGAFGYYSDNTYWHYWCDGGGKKNVSFRVYTYTEGTVSRSNLTATTKKVKEISPTDIKIPQDELDVQLQIGNRTFKLDPSKWYFVDDTVNYVNNDRQVTIQFGNVQASCNVEFNGIEPTPHAYKTVARDSGATGNLKVGEKLHYNVKVTNEATKGSIWKNVTITDTLPVGLELAPDPKINLARTKTFGNKDNIDSISLTDAKYKYDKATRTMTLEIPYYVLNEQAYEFTYDLVVDPTAIAGGSAGGANETRNLTNTVNVKGYGSNGHLYACNPSTCLPIPGETNPDNVKVEQVVPGSDNDPNPDPDKKEDPIAYLEHSKVAENMTDKREHAVTQVYDVIKYTMNMENTKPGSVFRNAQFVDEMPEGLEILLDDEHPASINKTSKLETDRAWSKAVTADSYNAATRTLTVPCDDMFYGEKATLTFYAQVTPAALGKDIGNTGTIQAATPTTPGDESKTNEVTDDIPEPTYPEPGKDKPVTVEKDVPVVDNEGNPVIDPETGKPIVKKEQETTGGVVAGDPDPKVEKTIAVVAKKKDVEVNDTNKNVPQVGDTVRTTVVISNLKEGTDWLNVVVNDSCSSALDLIADSIRVFDPEGNDITEQCVTLDPETQKIQLNIPSVVGGAKYTLQYDALVTGDAVSNTTDEQPNITDPVKVEGNTPDADEEKKPVATDEPTNMARPGDPLDSVIKTMKVKGSDSNAVKVGDTVQYTIVAGNMGDKTTLALRPIVLDPLPEGVELTSPYVYVTKMTFNNRTQEWEKASPEYVRKIVRSNVYNEKARTLVVPVGEVLSAGGDRVCQGQTGYQIVFDCEVTSVALAATANLGNIAYSESEKPSEEPSATTPDNHSDDPENPTYPTDDDGDIVNPDGEKIKDPAGNPIKPSDEPKDHPSIPDGNLDDYIKDQINPDPTPEPPARPTYPTDKDGDIINPDGDKVKDPEGNPIKPGDTKGDHPSIPDDVDLDDYIQNPKPSTPDPENPNTPAEQVPGAEPVRDPDRPVYPVDKDGDIIIPEIDPATGEPKVDDKGNLIGDKVLDPDNKPIKNTDTPKNHPSITDDIDDYIKGQVDPIPVEYPTDDEGDVVVPVIDPETGDPVINPETGEPEYEKVLGPDDQPVKPTQTEVLEDLDIPKVTALHQVIKEVAKLAEDGATVAGKVTYDSGKTGINRVTTEKDTNYSAGDKINTTVKVKNLVKGTRWSGAIVIDKPSNLIVTYYELVDPYGNTISRWGTQGEYGTKASEVKVQSENTNPIENLLVRKAYADTPATPAATNTSNVARLKYDGNQFRLSAAEIVGLEQYQVYYEGYVPEGVKDGNLEQMIQDPESTNPLDDVKKSEGPKVPENTPEGAKLPEPTPETPSVNPSVKDLRITLSAQNNTHMQGETKVGDEVTYTIKLENLSTPDKPWLDVVARADVPEGLDFVPGSIVLVTADGKVINVPDTAYDPDTHILAVNVGDIAGGQNASVVFKAEVTIDGANTDLGMTATGYGSLPSDIDPDDENYVKPTPGTAFVPEQGWEVFAETHTVITHTEKVYPNEKSDNSKNEGPIKQANTDKKDNTKLTSSADKPVVTQKLAKTSDNTFALAFGVSGIAVAAALTLIIARRRMKKD